MSCTAPPSLPPPNPLPRLRCSGPAPPPLLPLAAGQDQMVPTHCVLHVLTVKGRAIGTGRRHVCCCSSPPVGTLCSQDRRALLVGGQVWRLATWGFIHAGPLHLMVGGWAGWAGWAGGSRGEPQRGAAAWRGVVCPAAAPPPSASPPSAAVLSCCYGHEHGHQPSCITGMAHQ